MKPKYNKPALSVKKQAERLLSRNLKGISQDTLAEMLTRINYYRLRGYTYPYQNNTLKNSPFLEGVTWDLIWNDYIFDSQLRNIILEAIGYIEITIRTQLELQMSLDYGPRWYENPNLFYDNSSLKKDLEELKAHWNRSKEIFKQHYVETYDQSLNPPAWMIFETTTFGTVSKFYSNIKNSIPTKAKIAGFFGFTKASTKVFISWLQHINLIRNICAHHSRLFSRSFIIKPILPKSIPAKWVSSLPAQDRLYVSICIITYLLDICEPKNDFRQKLRSIMKMARKTQLPSMGFPQDWEKQPLFN